MRKIINHPTLAALAGAATLVALLAASPAQAATHHHSTEWHVQHYLTCLNLLVTDPARHTAECGPGHLFPMVSDSRGWSYGATPPPAPPPPKCHKPRRCHPHPCEKDVVPE